MNSQTNDVAGIARIKEILDRASEDSLGDTAPTVPVDFDLRTAQLRTSIAQLASIVERLLADSTGIELLDRSGLPS